MRYYTPSGRGIQARGVEPTVRVDGSHAAQPETGVVREGDLEHHLPAEGPRAEPPSPAPPEGERGAPTESESTGLGEIPEDPTTGSDVALRTAFEIVTGVLLGRR